MDGIPPVVKCTVDQCFYNRSQMCHAPAINVGDGAHPACDTFIAQANHINRGENGLVGACHVAQCRYNADLTCHADGIVVDLHDMHADCDTFTPRA